LVLALPSVQESPSAPVCMLDKECRLGKAPELALLQQPELAPSWA